MTSIPNKNFNDLKSDLTEQDVDSIVKLIGSRCRIDTIKRLRSMLTYGTSAIGHYGILNRLERENDGSWSYCAGQSYSDEIRTVRDCILGKV